jgi:hypothetical protein
MAYEIRSAASVKKHLKALTARERATVLEEIERQLAHEPLVETRRRKPLRPNPVAPWELRIGALPYTMMLEKVNQMLSGSWPLGRKNEMWYG